ncbi:MAG: cbb3-type cytochrome c oxidase subunit I [Chloroflexota bacterium]|nr:cbb3-type cytochrome c oxidase subunit I [Chloroflexota bacterium]
MTRKLRPYTEPPRRRGPLIPRNPDTAAIGFFVFSALWLAAASGMGALLGIELLFPDLVPGLGVIAFGRLEPAFANAFVFGWLTCAAIGSVLYVTPRVTGSSLYSESLANFTLLVWNLLVVAPGVALILLGWTEGRPLAEFIKPIDVAVVVVFVLLNVNFWATVAGRVEPALSPSVWFFGAALITVPFVYLVGNAPGLTGVVDALVNAFYVRALEVYWVLAVALGALHYVVARLCDSTVYSTRLAALAFWTLFAFGGLSAAAPLVWAPLPFWLQTLSVAAAVLMLIPAFAVVSNLLLTLRGRFGLVLTSRPIQFAVVSLAFLLVGVILQAIGPLRSVRALVGLTEWDLGVFTLVAIGAYTFAFFASLEYALPRILRRAAAFRPASEAQLWTTFAGAAIAGFALIGAGIMKGSLFVEGVAFGEISGRMTIPYAVAAGGYGLIALGGLSLLVHLFMLYTEGRLVAYEVSAPGTAPATAH